MDSDAQRIARTYSRPGFWSPQTHTQFDPQLLFTESDVRDNLVRALRACSIDAARISRMRIVDVGAGWGRYLSFLLELGADPRRMMGIDLIGAFVKHARERYSFSMKCADLVQACRQVRDADAILLFNVLSAVFDDRKAEKVIDACADALAPGGILIYHDIRRSYPCQTLGSAAHLRHVDTRMLLRRFRKQYAVTCGVWPRLRGAVVHLLPGRMAQVVLRMLALLPCCNSHVMWVLEVRR